MASGSCAGARCAVLVLKEPGDPREAAHGAWAIVGCREPMTVAGPQVQSNLLQQDSPTGQRFFQGDVPGWASS